MIFYQSRWPDSETHLVLFKFQSDFDEFLLCAHHTMPLGVIREGVVSNTWNYSQEKEKASGVGNRRMSRNTETSRKDRG